MLSLYGAHTPCDEDLAAIARRSTQIEAMPFERIDGHADVVLQDRSIVSLNGLITRPRRLMSSPIADQLAGRWRGPPWDCSSE